MLQKDSRNNNDNIISDEILDRFGYRTVAQSIAKSKPHTHKTTRFVVTLMRTHLKMTILLIGFQ